jgi:hypothetical protein
MILLVVVAFIRLSDTQQFSTIRADYDIYGTRLATNDHVVALAANHLFTYQFTFAPFGPDHFCSSAYASPSQFVINIAIGHKPNVTHSTFVGMRVHEGTPEYLELVMFDIDQIECLFSENIYKTNEKLLHRFSVSNTGVSILKMDPAGRYAYGFLKSCAYVLDVSNGNVTTIDWSSLLPDVADFYPRDADVSITNDDVRLIVLTGYFTINIDLTLPAVYLLRHRLSSMVLVNNITLMSDLPVGGTFTFFYNFEYVISITIEPETKQVLVALPHYRRTYLLEYNRTSLVVRKIYVRAARSVVWLDNGKQAALLLADESTLPWAVSQVQVINTSATNTDLATLYTLPNNQQTISFFTGKQSLSFIRLAMSDNQLIILTSTGYIIYAPVALPGYFMRLTEISSYAPHAEPCPAGTFKTTRSPSPCLVCPHGHRADASLNSSSRQTTIGVDHFSCVPCSSTSFCPLASVNNVNLSHYPSSSQAYPYPNSPGSTNFDDIILTNSFQLSSSNGHCLIVSPLFWTLLVLGLVLIILIVMSVLYWQPENRHYFQWLTRLFRYTDLIGDGQLWIGGLVSFALFVLIVSAFMFGHAYLNQYPIDVAGDATFACDKSLRNAKFTSSLQLLALMKAEDERPVFELLDNQNWTLTLDFIHTGFQCDDITVEVRPTIGHVRSCSVRPLIVCSA